MLDFRLGLCDGWAVWPVPEGFDDNDLRLLARRAAAVREAVRSLNRTPPFDERELLGYLDLLEAIEEPKDAELVRDAVRVARRAIRDAHGANLGEDKEPEAAAVDQALAALVGDLSEILPPSRVVPAEQEDGAGVDREPIAGDAASVQESQRGLRAVVQTLIREAKQKLFNHTSMLALTAAGSIAQIFDPLAAVGFLALFIIARLGESRRVVREEISRLLRRQADAITAFDEAVERNRTAIETVDGLYRKAKEVVSLGRTAAAEVRAILAKPLSTEEEESTPNGALPPPDCTTADGEPGYWLARECWAADTDELLLEGVEGIAFEKLACFRSLRSLELNDTVMRDLAPLAGLGKLQTLELNSTGVNDLAPLAGLGKLQTLELNKTYVRDLAPLAGLGNLQLLNLDNTLVSDLAPLAELGNLQTLNLKNTGVRDLAPLAGLGNLQTLELKNTGVRDLAPLAGLGNLQTLWLEGTGVSDLAPLKGLATLRHLTLADGRRIGGFGGSLEENRREVQEFLRSL